MSKWKLELKAPFGGYCFDWYNDANNIYGASNEANAMTNIDNTNASFIRQGWAQKTLTNNSQLTGYFHGNTTGNPVVVSQNKVHYLTDFDGTTEKFSSLSPLPLDLSATNYYKNYQPRFNVAYIGVYDYVFYALYNGNWEIARIADLAGTPAIDPDWGSTVPTGKKALTPHYNNGTPITYYNGGVAFGNTKYLGKLTNDVVLVPEYIAYGGNNAVWDIENVNGYIYVLVNNNPMENRITKAKIYIYKQDLSDVNPVDSFTINAFVSALIVLNNRLYAFYRYTNSNDNWFGVINGNQLQDIKKFDGDLPNPWLTEVYQNGILFSNGTKIYHVWQKIVGGEWIIDSPITPKYPIITSIMSQNNKIIVGSANGDAQNPLFDVSVYTSRTTNSSWESVTTLLADNNTTGFIDSIEVFHNKLSTGARCDLSVYINQNNSAYVTKTINTVDTTKHLFRNLNISNVNEFKIKLDWSAGSETNLCDIRRINIYGHTDTK